MNDLRQKIDETVKHIRSHTQSSPEIGIVLGTGLGDLVNEIDKEITISYEDIPHFPVSTVEYHEGKLIFGKISDQPIVAMQGRFHYYEGYTMQQITFPIRVMKFLGVKTLLISNACGGMNPLFSKGDLMIMDDHINLLGNNPLIGINDDELGPRFPDMSEPYSRRLIALAEAIGLEEKIKLQQGVYVAVPGPNLETRAEYRFLKIIGADVVGMSTIPENIVARHMGMEVFGISVITDECFPDALRPADINDIIKTANQAQKPLTLLMKRMVEKL
ncbi:purine-nucleoside phosphorylase [Candidatus Saccharibacteria bacterium]|nr:purine-nucleoside phosphorylase [Calditrichia bacterium]NIV71238.1 purine-nucleoside phosphorylase [Calditrichia bacterium]NIV97693.1 purine-nucleoside phosphorylase [Candidatus Saccharibacteria bacterium]